MSTPTLDTLLSVQRLDSGQYLVFPVAHPKLASFGTEEDCLLEQRLFLSSYLSSAQPEVCARFSLPDTTEARDVDVPLRRDDLPRTLQPDGPVTLRCVVIPHRTARWVLLPALAHTLHVGPKEDLEEVVRAEALRYAAALDLSPWAWLDLLPARAHRLERITVELDRGQARKERVAAIRRRMVEAQRRKTATLVLGSIGRALHGSAVATGGPPIVAREEPIAALDALLSGTDRASVLLTGESLVGKTAIVHAWLRAAHAEQRARFVYATSGAQLVAGMSGLGQWQERVRRVMSAAELLDAVLWFDDLRDLFGDRAGGHVDLAGAIKPWLDQRRVRVLGELTPEAADLYGHQHAGFFACLHPVRVPAQGVGEARRALEARVAWGREHEPERPTLAPDAVEAVLDLTDRYLAYRPFPGKAVRLFEELRSNAERAHVSETTVMDAEAVYQVFGLQTGIPTFLLREDRALRAESVRTALAAQLVGQREAVERVVETVCVVKAGLSPGDKPLATFLFVGPTGVGKTELARSLARFLFQSEDRLVRFDMSEYTDTGAAERLIRGTQRDEGLLTRRVRQQPFSVVLLDEIEKAHPAVFDLLLQVCGEGRLTDARGRTAWFHDTILILTSNLGTRHAHTRIGIGAGARDDAERYVEAVEQHFRPELVNRLDRIIPFGPLSPEEIRRVATMAVERIRQRRGLADLGVELQVSDAALDRLVTGGYSAEYGARALRRHLDDEVAAPAARLLSSLGSEARDATVRVEAAGEARGGAHLARDDRGELVVTVASGSGRAARRELRDLEQVADARRRAHALTDLPGHEEVRARVELLVTQLSYGDGEDSTRAQGAEIGALHAEHHRLSSVLAAVAEPLRELESIEELTLSAVIAGEPSEDIADEAAAAEVEVRRAMPAVLVALEPRHEIVLLAQELDGERALDYWLVGLIADAPRRGWQLRIHRFKDPRPAPGGWPADRTWGPPREPEAVLDALGPEERDPMTVMVRVRGPLAGSLLTLEEGWHRFGHVSHRPDPAVLLVRKLVMRWDLRDEDFESELVRPAPRPNADQVARTKTGWEVDAKAGTVRVLDVTLALPAHRYFEDYELIALEKLVVVERRGGDERARLLASPLDDEPDEDADEGDDA